MIAGRTVPLPVEAVDYPVTPQARANAPWLWQMRRAFALLMPEVRKHFAAPNRYRVMAETAWLWPPGDSYESRERLQAIRNGPRNRDWVEMSVRLALDSQRTGDADVVHDLYVFGSDEYHLAELVHAAHIVILQRANRWDVALNAAHQVERMATANYASFSKVLKPVRTAIATIEIARWARNTALTERDRYSFAAKVCRIVDDAPFTPNSAILNSSRNEFAAETTAALTAFESWFERARTRLERQAEAERVRWNNVAAEFGRRID